MSFYRAYFVPNIVDPTGQEIGQEKCWAEKRGCIKGCVRFKNVDMFIGCHRGCDRKYDKCLNGLPSDESGTVLVAGGVCAFITTDVFVPDLSDFVPPKWVCYVVVGGIAATTYYCCRESDGSDQCSFADCDSGKPCGQSGTRSCQWEKTLGGMDICGCFAGKCN